MRPKRQRVGLAFLGSVLLHGIALLFFALVVAMRPPQPAAPPPDEPPTLEIVQDEPPDTPPPIPDAEATPTPTPKSHQVVDATGVDADSTPPSGAALSDRTTRASSAEQNDGHPPGTSQAGRKMASFQFDPRPPAPGVVAHAEPTPPPETAPALPQPDRFVHRPETKPRPAAATPDATPAPTAAPDEFATAMATPTPTPEDPFDPSIRSTSPPLPKPADRSTPPSPVGATRSAENGTSATRGSGGVDTMATPASRYAHQVTQMIKAIWSRSVDRREDTMFGTAIIHCTINKDGLVIAPKIASNTSDVLFGSIALQAVVVAHLPPMPQDVAQELGGKLGLDITFDLTPMPQEAALH